MVSRASQRGGKRTGVPVARVGRALRGLSVSVNDFSPLATLLALIVAVAVGVGAWLALAPTGERFEAANISRSYTPVPPPASIGGLSYLQPQQARFPASITMYDDADLLSPELLQWVESLRFEQPNTRIIVATTSREFTSNDSLGLMNHVIAEHPDLASNAWQLCETGPCVAVLYSAGSGTGAVEGRLLSTPDLSGEQDKDPYYWTAIDAQLWLYSQVRAIEEDFERDGDHDHHAHAQQQLDVRLHTVAVEQATDRVWHMLAMVLNSYEAANTVVGAPHQGHSATDAAAGAGVAGIVTFLPLLWLFTVVSAGHAQRQVNRRRQRFAQDSLTDMTLSDELLQLAITALPPVPYAEVARHRYERVRSRMDALHTPGGSRGVDGDFTAVALVNESVASLWRCELILHQRQGWREAWRRECRMFASLSALVDDDAVDRLCDTSDVTTRLMSGMSTPDEALAHLDMVAQRCAEEGYPSLVMIRCLDSDAAGGGECAVEGGVAERAQAMVTGQLLSEQVVARTRQERGHRLGALWRVVIFPLRVVREAAGTSVPRLCARTLMLMPVMGFAVAAVMWLPFPHLSAAPPGGGEGGPVAVCVDDMAHVLDPSITERLEQISARSEFALVVVSIDSPDRYAYAQERYALMEDSSCLHYFDWAGGYGWLHGSSVPTLAWIVTALPTGEISVDTETNLGAVAPWTHSEVLSSLRQVSSVLRLGPGGDDSSGSLPPSDDEREQFTQIIVDASRDAVPVMTAPEPLRFMNFTVGLVVTVVLSVVWAAMNTVGSGRVSSLLGVSGFLPSTEVAERFIEAWLSHNAKGQ